MTSNPGSIAYADIEKMLSAIFTMCLLNGGISPLQLDELVRRSRAEANKRVGRLRPDRTKTIDLVLLGSILHRWNRNPKYLDADARPFPVKATGPAPSIQALFRAENSGRTFTEGFRNMQSARLIRRTKLGLYLPRNDSILLHTLTPEMVANLALSINRLVSTLLQNTAVRRRKASRLVERNALVPDLPRRYLEEFKVFSREQGAALVSTMNDWLENRRQGKQERGKLSRNGTVSAGIHVFAFAETNSVKRLLR
jgi:hypothetical protein